MLERIASLINCSGIVGYPYGKKINLPLFTPVWKSEPKNRPKCKRQTIKL